MTGYKKKRGMVLVLVMILILPLTLMALSMMQSGREQMKMSSASGYRLTRLLNNNAELQQFWLQTGFRQRLAKILTPSRADKHHSQDPLFVDQNYILPCSRTTKVSSLNVIRHCQYLNITLHDVSTDASPSMMVAELPLVFLGNVRDAQ